jgi:DNA-directed RNA polymerase specialized sigma24 family protein
VNDIARMAGEVRLLHVIHGWDAETLAKHVGTSVENVKAWLDEHKRWLTLNPID